MSYQERFQRFVHSRNPWSLHHFHEGESKYFQDLSVSEQSQRNTNRRSAQLWKYFPPSNQREQEFLLYLIWESLQMVWATLVLLHSLNRSLQLRYCAPLLALVPLPSLQEHDHLHQAKRPLIPSQSTIYLTQPTMIPRDPSSLSHQAAHCLPLD